VKLKYAPISLATVVAAIAVVGLALWLAAADMTLAQTSYDGLDIVFIVDQSGSMCGEACDCEKHPEANDPHGLRFYGVQYAMSWLGQNQWQLHPEVAYQVAVVNFGSRAQAVNLGTSDMPYYWETIAPGSEKEWLLQEAALEPKLAPGSLAKHHLGDTNFLAAFDRAQELFAQLDAKGAGQSHRRAIVVLTDGQAYIDEEGFRLSTHMEQLITLAQADFPSPRYTIYVVAMSDAERHYWSTSYADYWAQVAGDPARAQLVQLNNTDVGIRFREILLELTHDLPGEVITDTEIEAGPQIIPPYLAEVEFTFFKAEIAETTFITDALGRNIKALDSTAGIKVTGQNTPIEKVTVPNPEPGRWIIAVHLGSETRITMRQIPARGTLEKPTSVQYRDLPTQLVYQLGDINGNPLPVYQDPIYQLLVTATMQAGGQAWPINLRLNGQSRYEGEFVPSAVGSHVVHVEAISHDLTGKRIEVFAGRLNPFEVRSLVAEPRLPSNRLTQYVPASLRFGLLDSSNLSAGVAAQVSAQVVITDSSGQAWTIPLQASQADELTGAFTPLTAGPHQLRLIAQSRDAQGQDHTPLNVVLPAVDVVAPTMVPQLSPPPYKQYGQVSVIYQLRDGDGNPLALDPTYQAVVEARLETEGHQQAVLPQTASAGDWTAVFSPTMDGPQVLVSTFKVKNMTTGDQVTLADVEQELFVLKTTLVDVEIPGTTNRSQPVRSVLFQPQPLVVEVQLMAEGEPVAANQVFDGNPDRPFTIQVKDDEGRDWSREMVWRPTDKPGLFRAEGENLGPGEYTIEVQVNAPLKEDYKYGARVQRLTIQRIENPVLVGGAVAGSLLLLAGLVVATILVRNAIKLAQHPCRGFLVLVDSSGRIHWQGDLEAPGEKKKNRWVFDLGQAAPLSSVEKLTVTCKVDQDSESGVVDAQAILENGDEIDFRMQPQGKQEIVPGRIWLFKDQNVTDPAKVREMISSASTGTREADTGTISFDAVA
jgi:hypothetical protein